MVTFSRFISASLQLFARACVSNCHREERNRENNHQQVHIKVLDSSELNNCPSQKSASSLPGLKLHHYRKSHRSFIVPEVRAETCSRHTGKARRRGQHRTWHEQRTCYHRASIRTRD